MADALQDAREFGRRSSGALRRHRCEPAAFNPALAVAMWRRGYDTRDIAQALGCDESFIYAHLPTWRAADGKGVRALECLGAATMLWLLSEDDNLPASAASSAAPPADDPPCSAGLTAGASSDAPAISRGA